MIYNLRFFRPLRQIILVGDSILRNIADFSSNFYVNVHCLPGTKFQHTRSYIQSINSFCEDAKAVIIHVGTNNRERGVWGKEQTLFFFLCSPGGYNLALSIIIPMYVLFV